jgi:hypothetical protein
MGQTIFTASNAAWPTPSDWNNTSNFIEGIAGGGGGQDNANGNGVGGRGGAYGKAVNQTLAASTNNNVTVGAAALVPQQKVGFPIPNPPPSARFPRDKDGSARRIIEPVQ